jgi:hypothetical protein
MNPIFLCLFTFALIVETIVLILIVRRTARLQHRSVAVEVRLEELGKAVARLDDDSWTLQETPAEDRKKAREAERRFTEGVANILSFSSTGGGRKGEGV